MFNNILIHIFKDLFIHLFIYTLDYTFNNLTNNMLDDHIFFMTVQDQCFYGVFLSVFSVMSYTVDCLAPHWLLSFNLAYICHGDLAEPSMEKVMLNILKVEIVGS